MSLATRLVPSKEAAKVSLIWLHGLGDDSVGFSEMFGQFAPPTVRVLLPDAPERPITLNMGMTMRGWYDIKEIGDKESDRAGVEHSAELISELIDSEVKHMGGDSSKVILGGFSQGGAMALYCGLRYRPFIQGVVSCSAYSLFAKETPKCEGTQPRILTWNGKADPMVGFAMASGSFDALEGQGYSLERHVEDDLEHTMSFEELQYVLEWLTKK